MSNNKVSFARLHGHHCRVCKWRREAKVESIMEHYHRIPLLYDIYYPKNVRSPYKNAFESLSTLRHNVVVAEYRMFFELRKNK